MAADERAVITIDVDVKNLNRIQQVIADLEAVGVASEVNAAKFDGLVGAMNRHTGASGKASKASQKLYEKITVLDRVTMAFTKQARKMMYGVIAMSVEFAASALTLASVNAAFVIGKVAMKGYTLVMQGLAAGLAAVGAAAIAAAAAFDEYQTAQFAFRYQSDAVTTSLDKSSFAMRSLYKDTQLNIYGIKALSAAFAAVSKNSKFTGESQKMLQAFSDFAASSGDPTKGLQAAANAIGLIQKKQVGMYKNSKYMSQEAINAIKQINPALADLYKTGGGTGGLGNKDKFIEMLLSGELAEKAGVAGAAQNLAGTLFAQFKSYLANALVELTDVGKRVLNPVKEALHDIFTGLTRTFRRISGDLVAFGQGPFLKSLVSLVNKLEDFAVHLFRKYLPTTQGFFTRMGQIFLQLKVWFKDVRDSLDEMRAGGSIVIKTFGRPILEIFKGIGRNARSLAGLAERNKDSFLKFGDALKNVVTQLFEMSAAFRNMFTQALPFITVVLKGVAKIVNFIELLFNKIAKLGPIFAALGIGVSAMALKRGTRRGMRSAMRGLDTDSGAFYGYHQISAAEAARRNMTISPAGGPGPATGGTPLGGAMATAGSSIAAAMTTTLEPGLKSISSSSTTAASSLREVSGAVKQFGTALRNGFKGGTVDAFTGMPITEPRRMPGQSRADYMRDITRWHMQNKGDDLRGLEYTGPLGMPSRRAKSDPYAYGGLPGPYMPMQKQRYIDQSRRERFDRNIEAIADKRAERLGYDTTGAHYQLEKQFNSRTALDAAAQAQMTTRQRIASGLRSYKNKTIKAENAIETFKNRTLPNFLWRGSGPITGAAAAGSGGGGGGGINIAHTGVLQPGSVRTMGLFPYLQRQAGRTVFGTGYQGRGVVAETKNLLKGGSAAHAYQGSISQQLEQHIAAGGTQETFVPNRRAAFKAGLRTQFSGAGMLMAGAASALASKKGTDEAQGALQTGAGLMSMNAGLGIGVGGLGTAATAKTKLGGMAAGAVGGAAIGYKIGKALPFGQYSGLIGAGAGAILGTVFGFAMAKRNQRKMSEDAAKKINFAQLGELAGIAAQGAVTGSLAAARNKLKQQGTFLTKFKAAGTKEERKNVLKQYSTGPNAILSGNQLDLAAGDNADDFIKQMEKDQKNMRGVTASFDFFDRTMARLKQTTGMTSAEIQDLAMHKNVNLFDSTQKLSDITAQLGVGMVRTAKQIKDSFRDIRVAALGVFDRFAKGKEMKDALQGAFESIFYGNGTPEALADYMAKVGDYLDYKNPNSPLMNIVTMVKEFGVGGKFGQGAKFTTGTLAGKSLGADALKLGAESTNQLVKESSMNVANAIGEQLLATNVQGLNPEDLRNRLIGKTSGLLNTISIGNAAGATEEQKTAAKSAEAQMKAIEQLISNPASFQGLNAAEAQAKLEKYFPGLFGAPAAGETSARTRGGMTGLTDIVEKEMKLTVDEEAIRKQFMEAVKAGFLDINKSPEWWDRAPTWWNYKFNPDTGKFEPEKDTRSPRRGRIGDTGAPKALGATMAAHRSMDSMLTGKRSVTSSFRTTNLGSPSSDHAAGRAYDLTGQNLGQYASLAKSAGGFAEFHGAASSRHLHVVPALGRSGDTSSPVVVGATAAGGSYQGGDINITIVESKDARATAKEVAREIIAMQRNERRRM